MSCCSNQSSTCWPHGCAHTLLAPVALPAALRMRGAVTERRPFPPAAGPSCTHTHTHAHAQSHAHTQMQTTGQPSKRSHVWDCVLSPLPELDAPSPPDSPWWALAASLQPHLPAAPRGCPLLAAVFRVSWPQRSHCCVSVVLLLSLAPRSWTGENPAAGVSLSAWTRCLHRRH